MKDKWLGNATPRTISNFTILCIRKSDKIAKLLKTSPPNVTFSRNLVGPRLASLNALMHRLTLVQLTQETNEFRWNLPEIGRFFVYSIYRTLIQPNV
jgi:hypothetical protein